MNDKLNIECVDDNLKTFDEARQETLLALEKEPEADLMEGLYHQQLEKSTLVLHCMLWRQITPMKFTAKSRRATQGWRLWSQLGKKEAGCNTDQSQLDD